ncbi:metalloprotease-like protein [Trypanosoma rangeli]|uniref:Peptide deformylase n=1 Tax=Trypanosoma rangeli TaxID=5698 RepID=A0A3S5IQR8_TRYRA|nr:metalloprotease-like protein [Trypanosoma rangeli]RNF01965.1 metalloprotease-like protein [Trypanosoma rangeli]|eukprot:RNF01965.1 metalloprotease-like protein [Trypanosoma rangeli]
MMWSRWCIRRPVARTALKEMSLASWRSGVYNPAFCAAQCCAIRLNSSTTTYSSSSSRGEAAYRGGNSVHVEHPIVQLPARSLWCKQYPLDPALVRSGEFADMIERVQAARHYYQYPSLCAPQIGWNVQMFTLFDGTVFINPVNVDILEEEAASRSGRPMVEAEAQWVTRCRKEGKTCFAWEPCASCCFLMHYIERPATVRLRAIGADGHLFEVTLDKMRARMALHEMDHLGGVLFTRRIPDTNHVVPLEGFSTMSDWSDDYPSLEARSTYLYTTYTPPYTFLTDNVEDAQLLDRKFEDGIYPGCEHDRRMRIENAALEELQRAQWRMEKTRGDEEDCSQCMRDTVGEQQHEEDEENEGEGVASTKGTA